MARCPFCKDDIREWDLKKKGYLILTQSINDHIHVHGTFDDKVLSKELIDTAIEYADLKDSYAVSSQNFCSRKEIVFHNRQRLGDMLMFTCGVRDFKKAFPDVRVNVISIAQHIWDHNPYLDRSVVATEENTVKIGPSKLTNASNRLDWHFANAFRVSIEDNLGVSIPQGPPKPDIWFTEEEWATPPVIADPYWLICIGGEKGWGCKMFPFYKWQAFVEQNPEILFVQIGAKEDDDRIPRLQGKNIIDYVGKTQDRNTGIRDLFKLFLNAEGAIGLVSFHMHLSAAFDKPCIVIDGAREPNSFTNYPYQQRLRTDGCLPCADGGACWHCDIDTCTNLVHYPEASQSLDRKVPKCVDMIDVIDLTRALKSYYVGGRLSLGKRSPKPKSFKNIVREANYWKALGQESTVTVPQIKRSLAATPLDHWGIPYGGNSVTEDDWIFLESIVSEHKPKTALVFGAELATLLFQQLGLTVVTYETDVSSIEKIRQLDPSCDIRLWDGISFPSDSVRYDLAFVDGPRGGSNREWSTKAASELSDIVIVHDAGRQHEKTWQEMYLKSSFEGPGKGGHRCHLWIRKEYKQPERCITPETPPEAPPKNPEKIEESIVMMPPKNQYPVEIRVLPQKYIKFVSTARGWGGCARSCTTIMKHLLREGYKVEFIPFRNKVSSKEYLECFKTFLQAVVVTENYDTISEKCDVFFMYADDYVWEFDKPAISGIFENINADRKIMMLNYRRGKVGEIPWTRDWDKYMFLNTSQEAELLRYQPRALTKVLPPCTELEEFLKVMPKYDESLRIVRHSSQGDTKYSADFNNEVLALLAARKENDLSISLLPGPSFLQKNSRVTTFPRTASPTEIANFLATGNLFWYSLPSGYLDMGPRVILEAMASGLPVLADNWGGAMDRVTQEVGWLCNNKPQMAEIIQEVTFSDLERTGKAAREHAIANFVPERWVKELVE